MDHLRLKLSAPVSQGSIGGSVTYVSGLANVHIKAYAVGGGEQSAAKRNERRRPAALTLLRVTLQTER